MPSIVDSARSLISRPTLRVGDERCSLPPGIHALGGRAADAVALPALQRQPRAATITVSEDGATTLQRTTASIVVRIAGDAVGIAPVGLRDGATIEFADCRLIFEAGVSTATAPTRRPDQRGTTDSTVPGVRVLPRSLVGGVRKIGQGAPVPAQAIDTGAMLVDLCTGARHPLPARRIFIGRDESCDVIVPGSGVSRRHASVAPVAGGFMLRDESANGTMVNGVRVVGTYLLGNGDVVRVHDRELRVDLDSSAPRPIIRGETTTLLDLSVITRGVTEEQARAAANRALTASLEVVGGQFAGACFQIDRAVCSIGRDDENDVRIRDETVSSTHATLLRKGDAWFVVDLRSMNGTFVDGSRVAGERQLHPGARVRVGAVELLFRAIDADAPKTIGPPRPSVRARLSELLRSMAPPSGER